MVRNYKRKTVDRWSKSQLLEALSLIKNNQLGFREATKKFGISKATLYRHYNKLIQNGGMLTLEELNVSGKKSILSPMEEQVLEQTLLRLLSQGFSVSSTDVRRICFEYCEANGIENRFNKVTRLASDDWYYGFMKRHPGFGKAKKPEETKQGSGQGKEKLLDDEIDSLLGLKVNSASNSMLTEETVPSGSGGNRRSSPVLVPPEVGLLQEETSMSGNPSISNSVVDSGQEGQDNGQVESKDAEIEQDLELDEDVEMAESSSGDDEDNDDWHSREEFSSLEEDVEEEEPEEED